MGDLPLIRSNADKDAGSPIYYSWQFDKSYKECLCILNNASGLGAYYIPVC